MGVMRARSESGRHAAGRGRLLRLAGVLLAGGLLAGCSDTWDTVSRPLDPLPPADPQDIEAPQQGAGEYPSLSSVPDAPPRRPSRRAERQEIRDTLSADRANARYSDEPQTGEGIEARSRGGDTGAREGGDGNGARDAASGSEGSATASSATDGSSTPEGAPAKPEVAERMPNDDAGAATQPARSQQTRSQQSGSQRSDTQQRRAQQDRSQQGTGAGSTAGSQPAGDAPDVPQMQPSQQGEPIEVPDQPTFNGGDRSDSGAARSGRAQQQQSASRETAASAPSGATSSGPEVGQSRTLSRQETGGQTMADGGRRVAVIYFRHGSASLRGTDRQVLREVVRLYERRDQGLRVVGHASSRTAAMDPVDHRMANFDTSLKRAQAVVDQLVSMGVPREAIQLEARGDNEPVYHEFMPTGEAGNRRAEIFLQG